MAGESDKALEKSPESTASKDSTLTVSVEEAFSFLKQQGKTQFDSQQSGEQAKIDSEFGGTGDLLKDLKAAAKALAGESTVGDAGFTPKGGTEEKVGDAGFTPKGGAEEKVGDAGFTPKGGAEEKVGDAGFTPKSGDTSGGNVIDFTPKGADVKIDSDPGFTIKGADSGFDNDPGFTIKGGESSFDKDPGFNPANKADVAEPIKLPSDTLTALTGTGDIADAGAVVAQRVDAIGRQFPGLRPEVHETETGAEATWSKNGEKLTATFDDHGRVQSLASTDAQGRQVMTNFDETGKMTNIMVSENGKFFTLAPNEKGIMTGTVRDANNHETEKVTMVAGKLVFEDVRTHAKRAETFEAPNAEHVATKIQDAGKYDANTGTLTQKFGDGELKTSFDQGRTDLITKEGLVSGLAANGDINFENKKTGEASVVHADGTSVHLKADGTIEMFGPKGEHTTEQLSAKEQEYLKKHPEVDHREFAEIHQRFHGNQEKIDKFYDQLTKLDSARNLNPQERDAMRKDIIHHVAEPAEIYQGISPSCNVSVVERQLAMNDPEKYAKTIVQAVSEGTIDVDGHKVRLDVNNLKMADSSGRDLASRVFQTAALHAEFHPGKNYVNTPDGLGSLKPGNPNEGATEPVQFTGLKPAEIADIETKMTGQEKAVTEINSTDDLHKVVARNGYPMNITVDSLSKPFGNGDAAHKTNHVVTIVGEVAGPPHAYLVENQWGLKSDHSTPQTAITDADLVKNMTSGGEPAFAIAKGDHRKQFNSDGTVKVEDYLSQIKAFRVSQQIASARH